MIYVKESYESRIIRDDILNLFKEIEETDDHIYNVHSVNLNLTSDGKDNVSFSYDDLVVYITIEDDKISVECIDMIKSLIISIIKDRYPEYISIVESKGKDMKIKNLKETSMKRVIKKENKAFIKRVDDLDTFNSLNENYVPDCTALEELNSRINYIVTEVRDLLDHTKMLYKDDVVKNFDSDYENIDNVYDSIKTSVAGLDKAKKILRTMVDDIESSNRIY